MIRVFVLEDDIKWLKSHDIDIGSIVKKAIHVARTKFEVMFSQRKTSDPMFLEDLNIPKM